MRKAACLLTLLLAVVAVPVAAEEQKTTMTFSVNEEVLSLHKKFVDEWNQYSPTDQKMDFPMPKVGETMSIGVTKEELQELRAIQNEFRKDRDSLCTLKPTS